MVINGKAGSCWNDWQGTLQCKGFVILFLFSISRLKCDLINDVVCQSISLVVCSLGLRIGLLVSVFEKDFNCKSWIWRVYGFVLHSRVFLGVTSGEPVAKCFKPGLLLLFSRVFSSFTMHVVTWLSSATVTLLSPSNFVGSHDLSFPLTVWRDFNLYFSFSFRGRVSVDDSVLCTLVLDCKSWNGSRFSADCETLKSIKFVSRIFCVSVRHLLCCSPSFLPLSFSVIETRRSFCFEVNDVIIFKESTDFLFAKLMYFIWAIALRTSSELSS